jgi:hypothetical protein
MQRTRMPIVQQPRKLLALGIAFRHRDLEQPS